MAINSLPLTARPLLVAAGIGVISAPSLAAGPALSVDAALNRAPISPLIYGMNWPDPALIADLHVPVVRWGGNAVTRYNWQIDVNNRASDYFFENIANPDPGTLPNGSSSDVFVAQNTAGGATSIITAPMIGWTPKDRVRRGGFSVAKYGAQQSVDPYFPDAGNGVLAGGTPITGNDPTDTSVAIGPGFVTQWVQHLVGQFGPASASGVRFYCLDNEPDLWSYTHRDVHPNALTYNDLKNLTISYAQAVKAGDPGAAVLGPDSWGWSGYFFSPADVAQQLYPGPDEAAHGGEALVDWYLDQMRAYETENGTRLLDYLDLHFYPQGGQSLGTAGDASLKALRLRSTRSLWDPTYVDESWISDTVRLIPRMRDWVSMHYPGTKIALTEYNWGGLEDINGALAQADVLGILGREGADLAALWDPPSSTQPGAFAFRMYRNYDGLGSGFGTTRVQATSADQGTVAIYAAERADNRLTLMLVNKTGTAQTCALSILHAPVCGTAQVFEYGPTNLSAIRSLAAVTLAGGGTPTNVTVNPNTITLLLVHSSRADFNHSGTVTVQDIFDFLAAWFGKQPSADFNGAGGVSVQDIFDFLAAWFAGCK